MTAAFVFESEFKSKAHHSEVHWTEQTGFES